MKKLTLVERILIETAINLTTDLLISLITTIVLQFGKLLNFEVLPQISLSYIPPLLILPNFPLNSHVKKTTACLLRIPNNLIFQEIRYSCFPVIHSSIHFFPNSILFSLITTPIIDAL